MGEFLENLDLEEKTFLYKTKKFVKKNWKNFPTGSGVHYLMHGWKKDSYLKRMLKVALHGVYAKSPYLLFVGTMAIIGNCASNKKDKSQLEDISKNEITCKDSTRQNKTYSNFEY